MHRLDKLTSGIMVIAKTKPALVKLSKSFAERDVQKYYTAILNGLPDEVGLVDGWNVIDSNCGVKQAITEWKVKEYATSLKASENYLTLVQFKPKTGRFHQLRIHASEVLGCPIIGDVEHDGGGESAMCFRESGMYLCSDGIEIKHPEFKSLEECPEVEGVEWEEREEGIYLKCRIETPEKFGKVMRRERERFEKFEEEGYETTEETNPETVMRYENRGEGFKRIFGDDRRPVILFDGVCNMCNSAVNLSLDWDAKGELRFAALQSDVGRELLKSVGRDEDDISTIVLVEDNEGPKGYTKSDAVLRIGSLLAPKYIPVDLASKLALAIVPKFLRDLFYDNVADNRYRVMGKRDECRLGDEGKFEDRFVPDEVLE